MWSLTHFDDIINKMEGLLEPTVQTSTGGSCMAIRLSGRKVLFSGLKFLNMTPLNHTKERFSNMTVLNSHKERTAPPPRHLKRGGHWPPHFKNCSAGPVLKLLARDFCNIYFIIFLATFTASFVGFPKSRFSEYFAGIFNCFSLFLYLCYRLAFSVLPLLICDIVTLLQTFCLSPRLCGLC